MAITSFSGLFAVPPPEVVHERMIAENELPGCGWRLHLPGHADVAVHGEGFRERTLAYPAVD